MKVAIWARVNTRKGRHPVWKYLGKNRDKSRHFATGRKNENTLTREKKRAAENGVRQLIGLQGFDAPWGRLPHRIALPLKRRTAPHPPGFCG